MAKVAVAKGPIIELLPGQHRLFNDQSHFNLALPGGLGSGKTFFANLWHYDRARRNPNSWSWYANATRYLARYVSLETYKAMLFQIGQLENIHYTVNYSDLILTHNFGHRVKFLSLETWKSLVAQELSHATIDEPGRAPDEAAIEIRNRVRCKKATLRQVLEVGAPQGITSYAKRYSGPDFVREGPFAESIDKRKLVLHFHTYWNKFLPSDYLANLLDNFGHDPQLCKAWICGEFVPLFQLMCYKFNQYTHVGDYEPDPSIRKLILGFDFNVGQVAWVAEQQDKGACKAVAEAPPRCDTTDDACEAFKKQFPPIIWGQHEIDVDGDASGWHRDTRAYWSDYDIIENKLKPDYPRLRVIARRSNESVQTRIVLTNRCFTKNLFCINRKCRQTIESFNSTTYDEKGGIAKPSGDSWTHRSDAATYPLCQLYPLQTMGMGKGVLW